jgi:hypothetical protein
MKRILIYVLAACLIGGLFLNDQLVFTQELPEPADPAVAEDLRVRYAEACLQLARVEYERALELLRKVPGSRNTTRIDWLKGNVKVAEEQLKIARDFEHGSTMPLQAAHAEATAKSAEQDFQRVKQVSERSPGTIPKLQLDSLRLKAEVARLRAKMWRDPTYVPSLLDQMQWQIDRLTEALIEVDQRVRVIE